jgi:hypothetical protein
VTKGSSFKQGSVHESPVSGVTQMNSLTTGYNGQVSLVTRFCSHIAQAPRLASERTQQSNWEQSDTVGSGFRLLWHCVAVRVFSPLPALSEQTENPCSQLRKSEPERATCRRKLKLKTLRLDLREWQDRDNEEFHTLYLSPNIIRMIRSRRMRWLDTQHAWGDEECVQHYN